MSYRREMRQFVDRLALHGFQCEHRKAGHLKLVAPDGSHHFTSGSPSSPRTFDRARGWAHKHGLPRRNG